MNKAVIENGFLSRGYEARQKRWAKRLLVLPGVDGRLATYPEVIGLDIR